jgi:hypothetical protein
MRQLTVDTVDSPTRKDSSTMKRPTERIARHTIAATVAGTVLMAFAGVGLSQVVASTPQDSGTPGSTDQSGVTTTDNGKMIVCHKTHSKKHPAKTIRVAPSAWPAHQAHGDHQGACTEADRTATTSTTTTTSSKDDDDDAATTSTKHDNKSKNKSKPQHKTHGKGHGK